MLGVDAGRWGAVLFCGVATAVGWGMRGELGGSGGAAIPGALLGLAVAMTSGRSDWDRNAAVFGLAGMAGFALGGIMSYGRLIGYTLHVVVLDVTYGYAALGLVGGLWGAFGAGVLALAASPVRYRWYEILGLIVAGAGIGFVLHEVLVTGLGLRINPPRGDSWTRCIGACLAVLGLAALRRDAFPARMVGWGFVAGSVGFMVGEVFQVIPLYTLFRYDWWKVMEQLFGFILGAGVVYGVQRALHEADDLDAPARWLETLAKIALLWLLPAITWTSVASKLTGPEYLGAGNSNESVLYLLLGIWLAVLPLLLGAFLHPATRERMHALCSTKALFLYTLWTSIVLVAIKKLVPEYSPIAASVHSGFWLMAAFLTIATHWEYEGADDEPHRRHPALSIGYSAALFAALAILLGGMSVASHPDELAYGAQRRFGPETAEAAQQR